MAPKSMLTVKAAAAVAIRGENMILAESSIISTTTGSRSGKNIDLELTGSLDVLRGARILSLAESTGDAGNIRISGKSILVDSQGIAPSGILALTVSAEGGGKGGEIIITTTDLQVVNGGLINADTFGSGDGGSIAIAAESILVDHQNSQFFYWY